MENLFSGLEAAGAVHLIHLPSNASFPSKADYHYPLGPLSTNLTKEEKEKKRAEGKLEKDTLPHLTQKAQALGSWKEMMGDCQHLLDSQRKEKPFPPHSPPLLKRALLWDILCLGCPI